MRLQHAWIGNNGKVVTLPRKPGPNGESRSIKRWQVRWLLNVGPGLPLAERKTTTFETKARAESFIKELWKAHYGNESFHFDDRGWPTNLVASPTSVLEALEEYVESRWSTVWKANQRTKVRGRLLQLVALTVKRPGDQVSLLEALEKQRTDRGKRPTPTSTIEWAARWLRDYGLRSGESVTDAQVLAGRRWLQSNSVPLSNLSVTKEVTRLRRFFTEGRDYSTQRTYWKGSVVPFLNWLHQTEKVPRDLMLGQPQLNRDMEAERPDPSRIPNPAELASIANQMGVDHGAKWELFVRVAGYCALRISEAFAIRYDSFVRKDERLWLVVSAQEHRVVASSSDDGATRVRTGTKSTRDRTPAPRMVPIPEGLATRLEEYCGDRLCHDTAYLFTGPRGAVANDTTVRGWWHEAVATALPDHPTLVGIKPHVLRHAGMTYWFASKVDEKRIQKWGGWTSLVQMLDTYRGVIDSLEHLNLRGLDQFVQMHEGTEASVPTHSSTPPASPVDTNKMGMVTDLNDYRRRRLV
ncbi:MAG: tyrosine-type recombinase/integrase [Acidimicrobiales bacterium]